MFAHIVFNNRCANNHGVEQKQRNGVPSCQKARYGTSQHYGRNRNRMGRGKEKAMDTVPSEEPRVVVHYRKLEQGPPSVLVECGEDWPQIGIPPEHYLESHPGSGTRRIDKNVQEAPKGFQTLHLSYSRCASTLRPILGCTRGTRVSSRTSPREVSSALLESPYVCAYTRVSAQQMCTPFCVYLLCSVVDVRKVYIEGRREGHARTRAREGLA